MDNQTLRAWGVKPGPWYPAALKAAHEAAAAGGDPKAAALACAPYVVEMPLRTQGLPIHVNADFDTVEEAENIRAAIMRMDELTLTPVVTAAAIMPDACPSENTTGMIPVGGVAVSTEIHPGMHSADICCSVATTLFPLTANTFDILDAGMKLSHFGGGGRQRGSQWRPPAEVMTAFENNRFLAPLTSLAIEHFGTQGDGNHFFYVGRVMSTGQVALVTHHGSRGPGAQLYKAGVTTAMRHTREVSPETPKHNAWIPSHSEDGVFYWEALQTIRAWTKASHYAIHDVIAAELGLIRQGRFWNEHNFVFRRSDGLFYHAKGATPAWADFAKDSSGLTLIPLNMAEPILITEGLDNPNALGFAPHGAGRNFSRSAYIRANAGKSVKELTEEQAPGIDVRYFSGIPDISELPGAYKNAASVRKQIDKFGLAKVVDEIEPIGNIMAGDWQVNAPWRKKKGR